MGNGEDCKDTSVKNVSYNSKAKNIQADGEKNYGISMFGENKR